MPIPSFPGHIGHPGPQGLMPKPGGGYYPWSREYGMEIPCRRESCRYHGGDGKCGVPTAAKLTGDGCQSFESKPESTATERTGD